MTTTSEDTRLEFERLNDTGRRRVKTGVFCFSYPDSPTSFNAVCIDFGLTGHGRTFESAQEDLHRVVDVFMESSRESGILEDVLNAPDNADAVWHYRKIKAIFSIAIAMARGFMFVARVQRFWLGELEEYREHPHALAC